MDDWANDDTDDLAVGRIALYRELSRFAGELTRER
jgi:hypothetical protein